MRCSALQCVTVCCGVLQCVAACCSALQCDAISSLYPSSPERISSCPKKEKKKEKKKERRYTVSASHYNSRTAIIFFLKSNNAIASHNCGIYHVLESKLQYVAGCCRVLQRVSVAVWCSVVCCSVLQCVAVCCSVSHPMRGP